MISKGHRRAVPRDHSWRHCVEQLGVRTQERRTPTDPNRSERIVKAAERWVAAIENPETRRWVVLERERELREAVAGG